MSGSERLIAQETHLRFLFEENNPEPLMTHLADVYSEFSPVKHRICQPALTDVSMKHLTGTTFGQMLKCTVWMY